jgi:predicted SprT family Zn-dependent metalloprotease
MITTIEAKRQIVEYTKKYIDLGNSLYNIDRPIPSIKYRQIGSAIGTANQRDWKTTYQVNTLAEHPQEIEPTVAHEVAHLIADYISPDKGKIVINKKGRRQFHRVGHGPLWKRVMKSFGHQPERCHSLDIGFNTKNTNVFVYECACPGDDKIHTIGAKRHNRSEIFIIRKGVSGYRCRKCKHYLTFTGVNTTKHEIIAQRMKLPTVVQTSTPRPTVSKTPVVKGSGTKKDQAKKLFLSGGSRGDIINQYIVQLGMTKAGASTYYYNFQKGVW